MTAGVYIDPPSRVLEGDRFLTPTTGKYHSSLTRCLAFVKTSLEAHGVPVHTADLLPQSVGTDRHLYLSVGNHENHARLSRRPDVILSAFLVTESPIVEPRIHRGLKAARGRFKRILSCIDSEDLEPYVGAPVDTIPLRWPMDFRGVHQSLWANSARRFLVMVNMNKLPRLTDNELYTERMRAVEYFARTGDIDLYGIGWHKASMRMGRTRLPRFVKQLQYAGREWLDRRRPDPLLVAARRVYRGELETKWETLASYDFVLCFENTCLKGWLTEKLFEALHVGTIPIYWGATDVEQLVPPECFIDMRQFANYPELHRFLKSLDGAAVQRYREAGRAFLGSSQYEPFTKEAFLKIFADLLEQDLGMAVDLPCDVPL